MAHVCFQTQTEKAWYILVNLNLCCLKEPPLASLLGELLVVKNRMPPSLDGMQDAGSQGKAAAAGTP